MCIRVLLRALFVAGIAVWLPVSFVQAAKAPTPLATPTGSAKETPLQRIQRNVARINAEAATPEGEEQVVQRLSSQLRVDSELLRQQKKDWGIGYGEVAMVYGFARGGRPQVVPERVVEMRRSGMDWKAIAKELGVKVDAVATRMKRHGGRPPTPGQPTAGGK